MANLSETDKVKLEKIFSMGGGYVLDFSNHSLQSFIQNTIQIDLYNPKYEKYGTSKARRLKALWESESDSRVGKLIEETLLYHEAKVNINGQEASVNKKLFDECLTVAYRLQGKKPATKTNVVTADDFLRIEVDEVAVSLIPIDGTIVTILESRIIEIKKCLQNYASLSVIFLCGSVLEGLLLGIASKRNKEFNQSTLSPRDSSGKVKQFHEWTLSNFIDVAYDLKLLGLDVKKFSHVLRDFRNYIHPYQQMSSGFNPDMHTAKISWQVLKAALNDFKQTLK